MKIPTNIIQEWMNADDYIALKGMMIPVLSCMDNGDLYEAYGEILSLANSWSGQFENCPPKCLFAVISKELESRGL